MAVTAYIDGKATLIESHVLDGVDAFHRAEEKVDLNFAIAGRRRSKTAQYAIAAAYAAAPVAALALGTAMGSLGQGAMMAAITSPILLGSWRALQAAQAAPDFKPDKHGCDELKELVATQARRFPQALHVVYVSGHGDHNEVAGLEFEELSHTMRGARIDVTVLDACLCSQLEVMSRLAPWAGVVIASTDPVPAKGYPIEKMFAPEKLQHGDARSLGKELAETAQDAASSLAAIDTTVLRQALLPALDDLGNRLSQEIDSGNRPAVRKALKDSASRGLFAASVDLGSFLSQLHTVELSDTTEASLAKARLAYDQTMVHTKNEFGMSFWLDATQDSTLPEGWRGFLETAGYSRRPAF